MYLLHVHIHEITQHNSGDDPVESIQTVKKTYQEYKNLPYKKILQTLI
jgi:hypothetical protein